jgi:putative ABC transport system permease protein
VTGIALTPESQRTLDALPFVAQSCAITLHPVQTDAFGVRALQKFSTTFVAFEPRPFFDMTRLTWLQGDEASAVKRLEEGGAVIVAREFQVAQGLGVGDRFRCSFNGEDFDFEIVGVVTSPGLEIVSKFFNIGDEFEQQSLHAVFGSRRDLREKFRSDAIQLLQIALRPEGEPGAVSDDEAIATIRRELFGAGILDAGSGRAIKREIETFVRTSLLVSSSIALGAMLVASFGVANLIAAGIIARRYEFGVLRAMGATRGLVARLIFAEAVIVALGSCVLGTLMGFEGAFTGRRLDRMLLGIELTFKAPWGAMSAGWALLTLICLCATWPAVVGVSRRTPRELLGAVRET